MTHEGSEYGINSGPAESGTESCRIARLPLFVPAFNNPHYVERFCREMIELDRFEIFVCDNGSTYPPMLDLYARLPEAVHVVRLRRNCGPRVFWLNDGIYGQLPDAFCVSDPDIAFNPGLPGDFLDRLLDLTERFQIGKAGFALDISRPELMTPKRFRHVDGWKQVWESEAEHWQYEISDDPVGEPIYLADLDTTFALYNKRFFDRSAPFNAIRVAGRFTARHLPWYLDCEVPAEEREFYAATAEFSYYASENVPLQLRDLFMRQNAARDVTKLAVMELSEKGEASD